MKLRNWLTGLAIAVTASLLVTSDASARELKVGSYDPEAHYLVQHAYIPYFKEITRRTNGELTFKWFHGGTLVKAPQMVEGVKSGLVDISIHSALFTQESLFPVTHVMTLPFQFDTTVQGNHVLQKMFYNTPEFQKEYEGMVPVHFHVSDFFNLHVHKDVKPVRTLEDLKGMEIGAFSKSGVQYSELLGATPRNIVLEDLYVSLQRKAIDAVWFPTAPIVKWKLTDHTSNHSLVGGPFVLIPSAVAKPVWDSLTAKQRAVFKSMENELTNFTGALVDNRRASSVRKMTERGDTIVRLSPEEKARWVKQAQPAYDKWLALMKEKGVDGPTILARVKEYAKEFKGIKYTAGDWWGDNWKE